MILVIYSGVSGQCSHTTTLFYYLLDETSSITVALIAGVMLYLVDAAMGGVLNRSAKQRQKEREILQEEEDRQ